MAINYYTKLIVVTAVSLQWNIKFIKANNRDLNKKKPANE